MKYTSDRQLEGRNVQASRVFEGTLLAGRGKALCHHRYVMGEGDRFHQMKKLIDIKRRDR